jgi:hypothetical protein
LGLQKEKILRNSDRGEKMAVEQISYWAVHGILPGIFLCLGLAIIPRITTLFLLMLTGFMSGGLLWWLGWFFLPHFLVAGLATITYWSTNPVLVILAWIWALLGTGGEVRTVKGKTSRED